MKMAPVTRNAMMPEATAKVVRGDTPLAAFESRDDVRATFVRIQKSDAFSAEATHKAFAGVSRKK